MCVFDMSYLREHKNVYFAMLFLVPILLLNIVGADHAFLEDLNSIKTYSEDWPNYNVFYPIIGNTITFSVHVGQNAWIALTSVAYPTSPKYEILLGADGNKVNKIYQSPHKEMVIKEVKDILSTQEYRTFWIKMGNRHETTFNIQVGRNGSSTPFIEDTYSYDDNTFVGDINYFSIATTDPENIGYWKLPGVDLNSKLQVNPDCIAVKTNSTKGTANHKTSFELTDGVLRFSLKAHSASLIFKDRKFPWLYYEFVFVDDDLYIMKNKVRLNTYSGYVRNANKFASYWISISDIRKSRGYVHTVISVGKLGLRGDITTYIDKYIPGIIPSSFAIASTSDKDNDVGEWQLCF